MFGVSADCPSVINLALGLNMSTANPEFLTKIRSDCCNINGPPNPFSKTICDSNGNVIEIVWESLDLDGYINGSAIPPSIQKLSLQLNKIVGTMPKTLPSSILKLYLNSNLLTGSIPSNLPNGLTDLMLDGNRMTGDVPPLPASLQFLYLSTSRDAGNHFTGSISLNAPKEVNIYGNWITEFKVLNSTSLTLCVLSNNPIAGNYDVSQLSMCTQTGIYSARLLPWTISSKSRISTLSNVPSELKSVISKTEASSYLRVSSSSTMTLNGIYSTSTSSVKIKTSPTMTNVATQVQVLIVSIQTKLTEDAIRTPINSPGSDLFMLTGISIFNLETVSSIALPTTLAVDTGPQSNDVSFVGSITFILIVIGLFFAVCLVIVIAGRLIKSPIIKSRFARKNSYGTLNTLNSDVNLVNRH